VADKILKALDVSTKLHVKHCPFGAPKHDDKRFMDVYKLDKENADKMGYDFGVQHLVPGR
jgi:hypothetical protein